AAYLITIPALTPSPPALPYTTLFRSQACAPLAEIGFETRPLGEPSRAQLIGSTTGVPAFPPVVIDGSASTVVGGLFFQELVEIADRKSTRLNSSHQIMSYAVFCFKRKREFDGFCRCSGDSTRRSVRNSRLGMRCSHEDWSLRSALVGACYLQ